MTATVATNDEGLVKLEAVCILEAFFYGNHYDSFVVRDSTPLKEAIAKVNSGAAEKMKSALHMTTKYPGIRRVQVTNREDADLFCNGTGILLHIKEIYIDNRVGAAVVSGIDAPADFIEPSNSNRRPAHLTLWGNPPQMAGEALIGKSLELRKPLVQVTKERLFVAMKSQCTRARDLSNKLSESTRLTWELRMEQRSLIYENKKLSETVRIIDHRVLPIQLAVRQFLRRNAARQYKELLSQLGITDLQHKLLVRIAQRWKASHPLYGYYDDYSDYGYGDDWF